MPPERYFLLVEYMAAASGQLMSYGQEYPPSTPIGLLNDGKPPQESNWSIFSDTGPNRFPMCMYMLISAHPNKEPEASDPRSPQTALSLVLGKALILTSVYGERMKAFEPRQLCRRRHCGW